MHWIHYESLLFEDLHLCMIAFVRPHDSFGKRQEWTNIHSPTSWSPEIRGCIAFWVWNLTSFPVPEANLWQHKTTSLIAETAKKFIAFVLKHQLSWRCFKQCRFKYVRKSSALPSLSWWSVIYFFSNSSSKLVWVVSDSDKVTPPQDFRLRPLGSQRWCRFKRERGWGACGNRKQGMPQPFPFMPTSNVPRSNFNGPLWCLPIVASCRRLIII